MWKLSLLALILPCLVGGCRQASASPVSSPKNVANRTNQLPAAPPSPHLPSVPDAKSEVNDGVAALSELRRDWEGFERASLNTLPTRSQVQQNVEKMHEVASEMERFMDANDLTGLRNYAERLKAETPPEVSEKGNAELAGYRRAIENIRYPSDLVTLQGAISNIVETYESVPTNNEMGDLPAENGWSRLIVNTNSLLGNACARYGQSIWTLPTNGLSLPADRMSWSEYQALLQKEQSQMMAKIQAQGLRNQLSREESSDPGSFSAR